VTRDLNFQCDYSEMKIGVPKEIKTNENRVALVPEGRNHWSRAATPS